MAVFVFFFRKTAFLYHNNNLSENYAHNSYGNPKRVASQSSHPIIDPGGLKSDGGLNTRGRLRLPEVVWAIPRLEQKCQKCLTPGTQETSLIMYGLTTRGCLRPCEAVRGCARLFEAVRGCLSLPRGRLAYS